jgi:hypothetical protein
MRKNNMAELLSFLRGNVATPIAIFGIVVGAWQDKWQAWAVALGAILFAAWSDCADGWCAHKWGVVRRWYGKNGKDSNDQANAWFSITVPLAMVVMLMLAEINDWPAGNGNWFELWCVWGVVMTLGTFLFNRVKSKHHMDEALPAEAMQGLLQSFILMSLAFQCSYFAFGNSRVWYYGVGAFFLVLALWRRDRWFDRPESVFNGTRRWSH